MNDAYNLGDFVSLGAVWDMYPQGGCPGDYVIVAGVRYDWNSAGRNWGDGETVVPGKNTERIEGNLTIEGDLSIGGHTQGRTAGFQYLKVDNLDVVNSGFADRDHEHDGRYAFKNHRHRASDIDGYSGNGEEPGPGFDLEELRSLFLNKDMEDVTEFMTRFRKGIETGRFVPGMLGGRGARLDEDGNLEAETGTFRTSLRTLDLIYNRMTVSDGFHIWSNGGTVEKCVEQSVTSFLLTMRQDREGDVMSFVTDDILMGIFHQSGGFYNSYMRVVNVDNSACTVLVVVANDAAVSSGKNYPPCELMHLARIGNFSVWERQSSIYLDAESLQFCMLDGVDNFIIEPYHKKGFMGRVDSPVELGLPAGLPVEKGQMVGFFDVLLARNFFQVDERNQIIKKQVERDQWEVYPRDGNGLYWPYVNSDTEVHYVWWLNCRWKCIVTEATRGVAPGWDNTEWLLVTGDTSLSMVIDSTDGWVFRPKEVATTLLSTVKRGVEDITGFIEDMDWEWTRDSGDAVGDAAWNLAHSYTKDKLYISYENGDMGSSWPERDIRFTCKAFLRVGDGVRMVMQDKSFRV